MGDLGDLPPNQQRDSFLDSLRPHLSAEALETVQALVQESVVEGDREALGLPRRLSAVEEAMEKALPRVQALENYMPNNAYRRKVDDGHHHNQPIEGMDDQVSQGFGYQLDAIGGIALTRGSWPNNRRLTISGAQLMNVDYVVSSDGSGTHTTLAAAVAAAIATNADKTIWLCHSVTESDIDIGGLEKDAVLTISSHSQRSVVITANANADIFEQGSTGGTDTGGLHFSNVGFSTPTANRAIYDCNTLSEIKNLTFDHCAFDGEYLARQDGNDSLSKIRLIVHGCIGTLAGFYRVEGTSASYSPGILEAYDNDLSMSYWWIGGSQLAAPGFFNLDGGRYIISNALAFPNALADGIFQNLWIRTGITAPLFTTGASSSNIDDLSFLNLTIRFTHADGSFGNFGSASSGPNDSLVIRGIFGYRPGGSSSQTFLVVDTDWLNPYISDIHAPDWATLYSGPLTDMDDIHFHPGDLTPAEHTAIGDGAPHHTKYTDAEARTAVPYAIEINFGWDPQSPQIFSP
jgi:hypothetical protein